MKIHKSMRLEEKLIAEISELAEKNRRTFSNQLECLLEDALVAATQSKPVAQSKKTPRFTPPSEGDVKDYCTHKGYRVDPAAFIAHYESNGWKVGRNKMKSWKAACSTWDKREQKNNGHSGKYMTTQEKSAARMREARDPVKAMDF